MFSLFLKLTDAVRFLRDWLSSTKMIYRWLTFDNYYCNICHNIVLECLGYSPFLCLPFIQSSLKSMVVALVRWHFLNFCLIKFYIIPSIFCPGCTCKNERSIMNDFFFNSSPVWFSSVFCRYLRIPQISSGNCQQWCSFTQITKFSTDYSSSFLGSLQITPGKSVIWSALHRESRMN